jgi:hypothetical protein
MWRTSVQYLTWGEQIQVVYQCEVPNCVQALDKRNQNIIQSILESPSPVNVSSAEEKARTFYRETAKYHIF